MAVLQIVEHALRRNVAGAADDRACWVGAGAAGVYAGDGQSVWEAIGESESIVDVVNVTVADAEVFLDALRVKRHAIDD